jgi:hypothetical protein
VQLALLQVVQPEGLLELPQAVRRVWLRAMQCVLMNLIVKRSVKLATSYGCVPKIASRSREC